jgi:hypothetical protein
MGRPLKILRSDALNADGGGDAAGTECKENSWSALAAVRIIAGGISSAHSAYLFEDYNN